MKVLDRTMPDVPQERCVPTMIRLLVSCLFLAATASVSDAATSPNFVIFYVDDLGWADTSVRMMDDEPTSRSDFYHTPALERLAPYGEVTVYRDRPRNDEDKLARVRDAHVILSSRSSERFTRSTRHSTIQ